MKKNVAGQICGCQLNSKTDGSAVTTGTTTVSVTGDGGTYTTGSVGSGAATHEGGGFWTYAPAQAETNFDHVAFTFVNTAAVNATVQIYPSFPQTGDNFARIGAPAGASLSADAAAIKALLPTALVGGRMDSSTGAMAANVLTASAINADAITAAKVADGTIDAATFAAGAINAAAIAADAITDAKVAADVTIASVTGAVGSVTGNVGGNVVGSVASVTAGVTVTTNNDKTGYGLSSAAVQAIWDALTSALTTAGSVGKRIADFLTGDAFVRLGAAGAGLTALGDARIANLDAAVSTRLATAGYTAPLDAAGTRTAVGLASANLDTQLADLPTNAELATALGTADDAVLAQVALVKGATDKLDTALELDGAVYRLTANALEQAPTGGSAPTVGQIADAVWDETLADHLGAGSTGNALNAAGSAGDPWSTALPGAYGAGTAGKIIGDKIAASVTGAVGSVTGNVGGNVVGSVASVTADVGITQAGADKVWASAARTLTSFGTLVADAAAAVWASVARTLTAGTNIVLAKGTGITGFNDLSAAQVNTEADTALTDAGVTPTVMARVDVATSTRMATFAYTAPDNAGIVAIKAKTDNLPSDPADQSLIIAATNAITTAIADKTGYRLSAAGVDDVVRTALVESYAANGAAPTLSQLLFMVWSVLNTKATAGTTMTTRKVDGVTAAMTFTWDDATDPTAQTRAT